MYRPAARAALRSSQCSLAPARTATSRRFLTTEPPHLRSRSWKSSALRWGIAVAGIYYYNTSPVFAEHPENNLLNPNVDALEDETSSSTLDALTASSRSKKNRDASVLQSAVEHASATAAAENPMAASSPQLESSMAMPVDAAADLEEEAEGEGAFNPVTGEINWDCPCLGGMAYGPCGNEFREAFSCFVYSKEEPKGMDCIEKFQTMQTCFRAHPETYKGELEDDDELDESLAQEKEELQKEIAERRAAVDAHKEDNVLQGRLLEEPGSSSTPRPKKPQSTPNANSASKNGNAKSSPRNSGGQAPSAEHVRSEVFSSGESKATNAP